MKLFFAVLVALGLAPSDDWQPTPGALRFGSDAAAVARHLGPAPSPHVEDGFAWTTYNSPTRTLKLGFYRGKLGKFELIPAAPLTRAAGLKWAAAFLPEFKTARHVNEPGQESYFQQFTVDQAPFEGQVTLHLKGDKVTRVDGAMSWLD
jgi:hypothetical protein